VNNPNRCSTALSPISASMRTAFLAWVSQLTYSQGADRVLLALGRKHAPLPCWLRPLVRAAPTVASADDRSVLWRLRAQEILVGPIDHPGAFARRWPSSAGCLPAVVISPTSRLNHSSVTYLSLDRGRASPGLGRKLSRSDRSRSHRLPGLHGHGRRPTVMRCLSEAVSLTMCWRYTTRRTRRR
jgi:hypothetical protein